MDQHGTIFSFPDIKTNKDRTRIIIFATDNDLSSRNNGETISLEDACSISKQYNIKFYTGNLDKMTSSIVNEIRDTKTSLLKTSKKKIVTDHPEVLFIIFIVLFLILNIMEKRIKI